MLGFFSLSFVPVRCKMKGKWHSSLHQSNVRSQFLQTPNGILGHRHRFMPSLHQIRAQCSVKKRIALSVAAKPKRPTATRHKTRNQAAKVFLRTFQSGAHNVSLFTSRMKYLTCWGKGTKVFATLLCQSLSRFYQKIF